MRKRTWARLRDKLDEYDTLLAGKLAMLFKFPFKDGLEFPAMMSH